MQFRLMDIRHCVPQFPSTFCWWFFSELLWIMCYWWIQVMCQKGLHIRQLCAFLCEAIHQAVSHYQPWYQFLVPSTSPHYHSLHFSRNLLCSCRFKNLLVINARSIYKTVFRSCGSRVCELKSFRQNIWPFLSDYMELRWTSIFVGLAVEKNGQDELV